MRESQGTRDLFMSNDREILIEEVVASPTLFQRQAHQLVSKKKLLNAGMWGGSQKAPVHLTVIRDARSCLT